MLITSMKNCCCTLFFCIILFQNHLHGTTRGDATAVSAIQKGDLMTVNSLIVNGLQINQTDGRGKTLLHYAAQAGNIKIVTYLLTRHAGANVKDLQGKSPLDEAVNAGNFDVAIYLFNQRVPLEPATKERLFIYAAQSGNLSLMRGLVVRDEYSPLNPLAYLSFLFQNSLFSGRNNRGETLLHIACAGRNLQIVTYLVEEKQFDVSATDAIGKTPLHHACTSLAITKYLVGRGAQINKKDNQNQCPFEMKEVSLDVLTYLMEIGAQVERFEFLLHAKNIAGFIRKQSSCHQILC